jgi:hypothetical protein
MQHVVTSCTTSPAPIENHPDFPYLKQKVEIKMSAMGNNLEAARWVSGLLATIMSNAALLQP